MQAFPSSMQYYLCCTTISGIDQKLRLGILQVFSVFYFAIGVVVTKWHTNFHAKLKMT